MEPGKLQIQVTSLLTKIIKPSVIFGSGGSIIIGLLIGGLVMIQFAFMNPMNCSRISAQTSLTKWSLTNFKFMPPFKKLQKGTNCTISWATILPFKNNTTQHQ